MEMGKPKDEAPEEELVEETSEMEEVPEVKMSPFSFPVPMGYEPPNGGEPGKEFDEVCKLRLNDDGTVTVVMLGSTPVDGEVEEEMEEETEGEVPMETLAVEPNAETAFSTALNTQRGGQ